MLNNQQIREKRAEAVQHMRALTEAAESEERDLTTEEEQDFGKWKQRLGGFEKQLERAEIIDAAERSMEVDPSQPRRGNDGSFEQASRSYNLMNVLKQAVMPGQFVAGRENEISQEIARRSGKEPRGMYAPLEIFHERRDLLTSNTGGNLVPTQHRDDLYIDRLREALKVVSAGATVIEGLQGDQELPSMTDSLTGYWLGEHEDVTESDMSFDKDVMIQKTVAMKSEMSRRMIQNSSPAAQQIATNDMLLGLASATDQKAIFGDGTNNTPLGILNTVGIGDVSNGTDGGELSWEDVLELIHEVAKNNALEGKLAFLSNSAVTKKLRSTPKVPSTDSRFIMEDSQKLADYQLHQSSNVPNDLTKGSGTDLSALIFGNWSDLLIGYWSAIDILVNPYEASVFSKGGVLITAFQDLDILVRRPESFAASLDVVTT